MQVELPPGTLTAPGAAYEQIGAGARAGRARYAAGASVPAAGASRRARGRAEITLPGDRRRQAQLFAVREAMNRRVGTAQRTVDASIGKTAANMIVPFPRLADSLRIFRDAFEQRGLDYAVWGHASDGNGIPT